VAPERLPLPRLQFAGHAIEQGHGPVEMVVAGPGAVQQEMRLGLHGEGGGKVEREGAGRAVSPRGRPPGWIWRSVTLPDGLREAGGGALRSLGSFAVETVGSLAPDAGGNHQVVAAPR